jgi:hypothetical protein
MRLGTAFDIGDFESSEHTATVPVNQFVSYLVC